MGRFETYYAPTMREAIGQVVAARVVSLEETRCRLERLAYKSSAGKYDLRARLAKGQTLFVGEGNLSFSLALARLDPRAARNFVSSTFEGRTGLSSEAERNAFDLTRLRSVVLHGVDATTLERFFGRTKFDTVVFNFPNVASRTPIYGRNPNHHMVRRFLRSARGQLSGTGEIIVNGVDSAFYRGAFDFTAAARFAGLAEPRVYEFEPEKFPGYSHTNTIAGDSALARHDSFHTWVFRAN